MGNQPVKPIEQNNDRVITKTRWAYLAPFYPYIEEQIKADALKIEHEYESTNYRIFTEKDTLRINLNCIPKEEFAKWTIDGEQYTLLEKYISFDKSVHDCEAAVLAYYKTKEDMPPEAQKGMFGNVHEKTKGKSVLPIDLSTASILLSAERRLNLIQKYFTKPYSISVYEETLTRRIYYRELYNVIDTTTNFVLSWIRIPSAQKSDLPQAVS